MVLNVYGKVSLRAFLGGSGVLVLYLPSFISSSYQNFVDSWWLYILSIYVLLAIPVTVATFTDYQFKVAIRACCLGLACSVGISLASSSWPCQLLGWFLVTLALFHWSEYFATAITNPRHLALGSYILDHSSAYHIAVASSFFEFIIEYYFFPDWKQPSLMSVIGLLMVIGGECLRKLAMWTAGTNFNHYIRFLREDGHVLITHGIFGVFRHPSYVGWFYWSIGTQLMLQNPLCMVAYSIASWVFFKERITEEEITLINFFGEDYLRYQKLVPTGLPFIYGYRGYLW